MATLLTSRGRVYQLDAKYETFKTKNFKKVSNEQRILNFVEGYEFQRLCMFDPRIKNNTVIQITVEEGPNVYQYGNDHEVDGLQIKINPEEGLRCFKSKGAVCNRTAEENRILCAMTFLVTGNLETWRAIPLLGDEDQLKYSKILRAFTSIAWRKELKLVGNPFWATGTINYKGSTLENTGALVVETLSRKKAKKFMLCLADNGKILVNVEEKDINLKEVNSAYGCYLKTKYNFFRFGDHKNLERRK